MSYIIQSTGPKLPPPPAPPKKFVNFTLNVESTIKVPAQYVSEWFYDYENDTQIEFDLTEEGIAEQLKTAAARHYNGDILDYLDDTHELTYDAERLNYTINIEITEE